MFISQKMLWMLLRFCSCVTCSTSFGSSIKDLRTKGGRGLGRMRTKADKEEEGGFQHTWTSTTCYQQTSKTGRLYRWLTFSNLCCIFPGLRWSACKSLNPPSPDGLFPLVALISRRIKFHRPVRHLFLLTTADSCPQLSSAMASQTAWGKLYRW